MFISLKSKKEIYKPKKISTTTKTINSKLKKKKKIKSNQPILLKTNNLILQKILNN